MKNSIVDIRIVEPHAWAVDDLKHLWTPYWGNALVPHTTMRRTPKKSSDFNRRQWTVESAPCREASEHSTLGGTSRFLRGHRRFGPGKQAFLQRSPRAEKKRHWKLVSLTILGGSRTKRYRVSVVSWTTAVSVDQGNSLTESSGTWRHCVKRLVFRCKPPLWDTTKRCRALGAIPKSQRSDKTEQSNWPSREIPSLRHLKTVHSRSTIADKILLAEKNCR